MSTSHPQYTDEEVEASGQRIRLDSPHFDGTFIVTNDGRVVASGHMYGSPASLCFRMTPLLRKRLDEISETKPIPVTIVENTVEPHTCECGDCDQK